MLVELTIAEIFADDIPLGHINPIDFIELVVRQDIRPERPDDEDAPQLSDTVWELAERCWVKDPKQRPIASAVCDTITHLLNTTTATPPKPISSPSHLITPTQAESQPHVPAGATLRPLTAQSNPTQLLATTSDAQLIPDSSPLHPIATTHSIPQPLPTEPQALISPTNIAQLPESTSVAQPIPNPSFHSILLAKSKPLPHAPVQASQPRPLTPPQQLTLRGHTDLVLCATFSPDGKYIASGSRNARIMVWDAQTGNLALGPLERHTNSVYCVAFSPNGRHIASGSSDYTILVWDVVTGKVIVGPFQGHTNSIESVCFSPDGEQIASGSSDNIIRVWDARTGNLVGPLAGHTNWVTSVTFSGDGKRLASGSDDKTIRIWDIKSGRLIHGPLTGHQLGVGFVAFSPDGKRIVSAEWGGDVCVWDTDTGVCVSGPSKWHAKVTLAVVVTSHSTDCCAVSSDGKWIAARAGDGKAVQVGDSKTGRLAVTFLECTERVHSISFSPDSKRILSSSDDNTVRVHTLHC